MLPFKTLLPFNAQLSQPIYLQLSNQVIQLIQAGTLIAGYRLPSSRELAVLLGLHRKTIIAVYDELTAQGWIESKLGSGTFVAKNLPFVHPQKLERNSTNLETVTVKGVFFKKNDFLNRPLVLPNQFPLKLDDGFPDVRLAPTEEFSRAMRRYFLSGNPHARMGYTDPQGSRRLRTQLADYLNDTRGLKITAANVLITRGTMMGLHLACQLLLEKGDNVIIGEGNWSGADMNFRYQEATLHTVPVDENGMVVEAVAALCKQFPIRLLYITPHHHYPTTVTLRADRRLKLLQLAEQYSFAILEDDYDFDFHYQSSPLLPLASADRNGMVIYLGSFSKSIAPAFRIGYLVASEELVTELAKIRRITDRQGDVMDEYILSELMEEGHLKRHLRKSLKAYHQRRDVFCEALQHYFPDQIQFKIPDGGMAVWATFTPEIDVPMLSQKAQKEGLFISNGLLHNSKDRLLNSVRLGFASSTEEELGRAVEVLRKIIC